MKSNSLFGRIPLFLTIAASLVALSANAQIPAQRVSNIAIGGRNLSQNANPANFTLVDTRLFFTASDNHGNRGVYEKDLVDKFGNLLPTVWTGKGNTPKFLKKFKLPVGVADMNEFTATESDGLPHTGKVYFHVPGSGLWMTYGKTPVSLGKFDDALLSDSVTSLMAAQAISDTPVVYFGGWMKKTGQELYRSEGTVPTTKVVDDIVAGTGSSHPDSMVELSEGDEGSTVFFRATSQGALFPQLWETSTTDLTHAALVLSSTLGAPAQLVTSEDIGGCYFVMPTTNSNGVPELWSATSAPGSATPVTSGGVNPQNLTVFPGGGGGSVIFSGSDPVNGTQLWEADSLDGSGLLNIINPNGNANPYDLTAAGSEFYFGATVTDSNSNSANYLFVTDGNEADTAYVANVTDSVVYYPTNPSQITPVLSYQGSGPVYFVADGTIDDGAGPVFTQNVLWILANNDGVEYATPVLDANNKVVTGAYNLTSIVNPSYFYRLYFARDGNDGFGTEVWVTEN